MALFGIDVTNENKPFSAIIREDIQPVIRDSIQDAEVAISKAIGESSRQLDIKIDKIANEIHNQRKITKQDIEQLIDYASCKFAEAVDERVNNLRHQVSELVDAKAQLLKDELENAAVRSRKQLWMNASVAIGTSILIAIIAVFYKRLGNNEIDLFTTFRIIFMSMTIGAFTLLLLKLWRKYISMNLNSKNLIQVVTSYAGMFRPNGAAGLFIITLVLALVWMLLVFYQMPLQKLL